MKIQKYIKTLSLVLLSATILTTSALYTGEANAETPTAVEQATVQVITATPIAVVNSPKQFLNKQVVMKARFDKFSTLGLDYKVALRSSEDYISFLILRDNTTHDIPLSEMKLFLKRDVAEKFIELNTKDEIEIKGKVFSDALGDPWVDVTELKILKKVENPNKDGAK